MKTKMERLIRLLLPLLVIFALLTGVVWADGPAHTTAQKQRFKWIVTNRLTVENRMDINGIVYLNDELHIDNSQDSVALNVQGHSTQTNDLFNVEDSDSFDRFDVTNEGHTRVAGARDATTGYDYFLTVTGTLDGLGSGAKTYGEYIEVNRPLGSSVQHGNIDDAGLKIRVDTDAITTTAGYVLNGADIQAKTDNEAMQPTLRGAQITADTDADSYTDYAYGLRVYVEGEGMITTTMQVADFELSRKQATDPTYEYGLNIRNTSTAGGGADVALRIESSYGAGGSATDDDWDYLVDLSPADARVADLRFSQSETLDNLVDGVIRATGDISVTGALTVQQTSDLQGNIYDSLGDVTVDDGLIVEGNAVINTNLYVTGTSDLRGAVSDSLSDLMLNDNVNVSGNLDVDGNIVVTGTVSDPTTDLMLNDNVNVSGDLDIDGGIVVSGTIVDPDTDLMINDNLNVSGNTDVDGNLVVTGTSELRDYVYDAVDDLDLRDNVTVTGNVDVSGGLVVTGTSELRGYIFDDVDDLDFRDSITVAGDVDIVGNLAVTGTSNLQGDVRDERGTFTVADDMLVDGQANAVQLTVQGHGPGEQSLDLFVCEESGGTDMFSVGPTGNTFVSGTLDVRGAVSDGDSDLWVSDDITVTGDVDISANLTVTGTSDFLGDVSDSQGDLTFADHVSITQNLNVGGDTIITGSATITGSLTVDDVFNLDDSIYTFSGAQSHSPVESMFIGNPTAADLILTLGTTGVEEGDFLYIVNIHASNCITIVDTGATSTGNDQRLDQDDAIGFIYAGATWVEFTISDNS